MFRKTGDDNPFNGIDVVYDAKPTFADIDGDGDLDMVVGNINGTLWYFRNESVGSTISFIRKTGVDNPFDGIDFGISSAPEFSDIDGDGDLDLVVGVKDGRLYYVINYLHTLVILQ